MSPCAPADVMEKQLAFIARASLLSSVGTAEAAFKFPFWHFCGDTLVKIIKVSPDKTQLTSFPLWRQCGALRAAEL